MVTRDPVPAFLDAMHAAGIPPDDPAVVVADGTLHRYHVAGDRPGSINGWFVLHTDGRAAGAFGSWRAGVTEVFRHGSGCRVQAPRVRAPSAGDLQRHAEAAARAAHLWHESRPANPGHPYLRRKRVQPHGARQLGDRLVLPVATLDGTLTSLQFIGPDGTKRLLRGGRKRGCGILAADPPDPSRLLISEGWATAASLAEADPAARVVAAVDAGNLEPVARAALALWPDLPIVVAGDADPVGRRYAHAAAHAVGGAVLIPERDGCDWNDMLAGGAP